MNAPPTLATAIQLTKQGQLAQSRALLDRLAGASAAKTEVHHWRAIVCARMGDYAAARASIASAIRSAPGDAALRLTAANIEQDAKDLSAALEHADAALKINPAYAEACNNRGILLGDLGRLEEARGAFQKAAELRPGYARARANLANVLIGLERFDEAAQHAARACEQEPGYAYARYTLGRAHLAQGRLGEAERALTEALQLDPSSVEAVLALAGLMGRQRRLEERARLVRAALARQPHRQELFPLAADVAAAEDDEAGFYAAIDAAIAAYPGDLALHARRAAFLPSIYRDTPHLEQSRARLHEAFHALRSRANDLAGGVDRNKLNTVFQGNFLLGYQGRDDKDLQRVFGQTVHDVLSRVVPEYFAPLARRSIQGRRIRVGFCCGFLYKSTVGNYFSSWITGLPAEDFETHVFYAGTIEDELTEKIRRATTRFETMTAGVASMAGVIRAADLDVLIYPEVGMEQSVFLLAALRLAPVQLSAWGHPVTTGHPNIDGFISCAAMEPEDAADHYGEALHLLPGIGTRYPMAAVTQDRAQTRADFSLPPDGTLILLPQSLFKIHPDNDALIVEILAALPRATLVMFAGQNQAITQRFVERLRRAFDANGLPAAGRVKILPSLAHADYLAVNRLCDFMIDTLHWSGGNTTLDAIASGLPVVTLPGKFMRGRQSMAMLRILGLVELVAGSAQDYVRIACRLGEDAAWRDSLRQTMIRHRDRLFDDPAPIDALVAMLRRMAVHGA